MRAGRPTEYTPEIAATICARLSAGESLRQICLSDDIPDRSTIHRWLADPKHGGFRDQYRDARELYADEMFDDLINISDDSADDVKIVTDKSGNDREVVDYEVVNRSKLKVETRKWVLSRMFPKKYGDRQEIEHSGGLSIIRLPAKKPEGSEVEC